MGRVKVLGIIIIVLMVLLVGCGQQTPASKTQEKTITIGILGALTGPLRAIGEGATSCHDYFTNLNETKGGIQYLDPKTGKKETVRVRVLLGDHGWDVAKSVSLYERFKQQGMQYVYANGSSPSAAIYTACVRDKIPGQHIDCTCDPYVYELPRPFLAMATMDLPSGIMSFLEYHTMQWKKSGNPGKLKLGILAADVPSRRVLDKPEFGIPEFTTRILGNDLDYQGAVYIPVAPVDVKAELSRVLEKGPDLIMVEHWGSGACRVVLNDAVTLGLHKKGITLDIDWLPADVAMAEPKLIEEYTKSAKLRTYVYGWCGNEPASIQEKYPGLKLAFDLAAKYHDGQIPEQRAGWYYLYGVSEAIIGHQVIQNALEKVGYADLNGDILRDSLFGLDPVNTGGLLPTYHPDKNIWQSMPSFKIADVIPGHIVVKEFDPWLMMGPTKIYPGYHLSVTDEWKERVWIPKGYY